jgi:ribonuclease BN (tRNA processing enzyme)
MKSKGHAVSMRDTLHPHSSAAVGALAPMVGQRMGQDAVMRVRFVGSGDAFGSGERWQTCIHLAAEGQVVLVDCGATSLTALKAQGLDPNDVGAVAVTHLHGDHFSGLPFLILDGQFSRRTSPLLVAGPPGIRARLAEAMETMFPGSSRAGRRFPVEVTEPETDGTPAGLGAATVCGWEVEHACGAPPLALRVELGGVSFAYSGDTQWTPALAGSARGADLSPWRPTHSTGLSATTSTTRHCVRTVRRSAPTGSC